MSGGMETSPYTQHPNKIEFVNPHLWVCLNRFEGTQIFDESCYSVCYHYDSKELIADGQFAHPGCSRKNRRPPKSHGEETQPVIATGTQIDPGGHGDPIFTRNFEASGNDQSEASEERDKFYR
jgi:hypothetical protein